MICLKFIELARLYSSKDKLKVALEENNELISIFVKSVETAQRNLRS